MKFALKKGTTSQILRLKLVDSATGAGATAKTNSDVTAYYIREGDNNETAITLSAGTVGTWSSGGFKLVDDTNMPGIYELGVPNAALADGAESVAIQVKGSGLLSTELEIDLVDETPFARLPGDHTKGSHGC